MKQSFTISPDTGRAALLRVTDVPNVQHVAVLDAMGLCLMHSGPEPVSTMLMTDWTVVARSAFAACDDLGQRCGAGPSPAPATLGRSSSTAPARG